MKEKKSNNLKLGIFVFAGVALFVVGIYFIGQRQQLFSSTFQVSGVFKDISGLQVGNNVRFSGINIGIVEEIEQISDSAVRVDMSINQSSQKFIKKTAKAIIGSDGLMGNKILLIVPGEASNQIIKDGDTLLADQPVSMDDILRSVKTTADNTSRITGDMSIVMQNIREGKGTVGKLLMDSSLAQNVQQAMYNIKQGAGGFKQNMDAASHSVLLRGYLKKKEKKKEEAAEELEKQKQKAEKDGGEKEKDSLKENKK